MVSSNTALSRRRSAAAALVTALALLLTMLSGSQAAAATSDAPWQQRLDRILDGKNVGVTVRVDRSPLYTRRGARDRIPASNEKLLLTLALFDTVDPATRIPTTAAAEHVVGSTVLGDLWLIGNGDPSLTGGGAFARALPYTPTRLKTLAREIKRAGITQISGSVVGDTSAFGRDWWATGWRSYYPAEYAPLASALAFNGNVRKGRHISDPELRAARSLTRKLRGLGVQVGEGPSTGSVPADVAVVAEVESAPLRHMVRHMNRYSSNFHAEMLVKYLDAARGDDPVTLAGGAADIRRWAAAQRVRVSTHDGSGLSWSNRASTQDLARLLDRADGDVIRSTLAWPGIGTLERRLHGTRVRAKTGTLPGHSALSGYVYLQRRNEWAAFSILCDEASKTTCMRIEDRVVEVLAARAR